MGGKAGGMEPTNDGNERSVYSVLAEVQHRVTCKKGRVNKFGGYSYRSLEDINAALKPLCQELRCGYYFMDDITPMSTEDGVRWYLRATVTFWAEGSDRTVSTTAFAREQDSKKGMDDAQVTGLASSYARKYAACALFAIDSGEEVDAMDNGQKPRGNARKQITAEAKQDQSEELLTLVGQFADMKGKTADEVMHALNKSNTMNGLGVAADAVEYDVEQTAAAIELLKSWIEKSRREKRHARIEHGDSGRQPVQGR